MGFDWDEPKWRENLEEHGVDFADAALIFANPILEAEDDRQEYGEVSFRALVQDHETHCAMGPRSSQS
jgi:uncharacterized protein